MSEIITESSNAMNMQAQKSPAVFTKRRSEHSFDKLLTKVQGLVNQQNYDAALDLLDQIYPHNTSDLNLNLVIAEIHLAMKQYREAQKFFNRASKLDSNNAQALYGLGKSCYLRGDIDSAIAYLQSSLVNDAFHADVYNDLGTIFDEIGRSGEAEQALKHSIKASAGFVSPVINLSSLLYRNRCHDEALFWIDEYLNTNPNDDRLLVNKGVILEDLGRFDEAIAAFSAAIVVNDKNIDAYFDRAYCLLKLTRIEDARTDLKTYLEIVPDAEQVKGLLALTYTLEGKFQDSVEMWKDFLPMVQNLKSGIPKAGPSKTIDPIQILKNIDLPSRNGKTNKIGISLVIPVLDEEGSLLILYESIKQVMHQLGQIYEIIFIDDGSNDNSLGILSDIAAKDPTVSVIKFRKNYGQTAAFAAGFKFAQGEIVITMDADLQNDPKDIPRLLEKMSEGYDLVSGWRKDRQDKTLSRKLPSFFANRIINKLIKGTQVQIHDFGCSLKAYKKGVIKNIKVYGEMHRFIPAYAAWLGIRVAEIPVNHHYRRYGYTKYGLNRVGRVVLDLITLRFFTGFRTKPLQFFGKIAVIVTAIGSLISLMMLIIGFFTPYGIDFQTFILMLTFAIMGGLQFIIVGLLSEIIMRGFLESQNRDEYVVETILGDSLNST